MEVPAKRMKITTDIWDCLLDFITDHPEMVTGKFVGPTGKQRLAELWNELANKLNALGGGTKSASKWQKSFSDWKYNVKQKYAEIKLKRSKTGGGPLYYKNLTVQEERLLSLIGTSSIEGDGIVEEIGLAHQVPTEIEAGPSTSGQHTISSAPPEVIASAYSPEPEEIIIITSGTTSPNTSRPSSQATDISDVSRTTVARQRISHFSHDRQSEAATLQRFQAETMEVLSQINENLSNMAQNLNILTDAIVKYVNRN